MKKKLFLAGAALTLPLLVNRFQTEMVAARTRQDAGSLIANTRRGPIEYVQVGSEEDLPVLISHSSAGGYDQSVGAARRFPGCRVIAVSRGGYLRTPLAVGATPADMADSFADLLDVLNIPAVMVAAYSAGSMSAIEFALRHPERCRGLILGASVTAPIPFVITDVVARLALSVHSDFMNWLASETMYYLSSAIEQDADTVAVLDAITRNHPMSRRFPGYNSDIANIRKFFPPLEQIQARTLFVHGEWDSIVPMASAQLAVRRIPRAELVIVPKGMHDAPMRAGAVVQPAINRFLNAVHAEQMQNGDQAIL